MQSSKCYWQNKRKYNQTDAGYSAHGEKEGVRWRVEGPTTTGVALSLPYSYYPWLNSFASAFVHDCDDDDGDDDDERQSDDIILL